MLTLLLTSFAINSVHSINEYPQFYAINPKDGEQLKDLSIFARLGECPIWNSTTSNLFLHKNPNDKHWYLEQIEGPDPEVDTEKCTINPHNNFNTKIEGLKNPSKNPLPVTYGWINTEDEDEKSINLFQINVDSDDNLDFILDDYDVQNFTQSIDDCMIEAFQLPFTKEEYLFVSATNKSKENEGIICRYKLFSSSKFDSVSLERKDKSILNVFYGGNGLSSRTHGNYRWKRIKIKKSKENTLPPSYVIKDGKNQNIYARSGKNCFIYKSADSDSFMYRELDTGFWYIEDIEDSSNVYKYSKYCSINGDIMHPRERLGYRHNKTLPPENGWDNTELSLQKFEPCDKVESFTLLGDETLSTENITECLNYVKKGNYYYYYDYEDFQYAFMSVKDSKITCFGISSKEDLEKISIASDKDSVLHILNKTCNFDIKMNDFIKEDEMTEYIIGGIVGGFVLIIIIVSIIIIVIKKLNTEDQEVKSKKAIVHQNDLYGNISNQEEHEERYDTNIVDTNQYYEDYDIYELK